jgi:hypothetical protein
MLVPFSIAVANRSMNRKAATPEDWQLMRVCLDQGEAGRPGFGRPV